MISLRFLVSFANKVLKDAGISPPVRSTPHRVGRDKSRPYIFWLKRLFEMYWPLRLPWSLPSVVDWDVQVVARVQVQAQTSYSDLCSRLLARH